MREKISCIYCIENNLDGKKYIGQSQDFYKRKRNHISHLRRGEDCSTYLQHAWDKHGEENFTFYIIEICKIEDLDFLEIEYIKSLKTHVSLGGYNISWGGDAPMRGRTHSEETKNKMSIDRTGEKHPNFGKPMSEEQKIKLSVDRIGEKHWMWGKKHSPETIQKMKDNNKRAALGKHYTEEEKEEKSKQYIGKNKSTKSSTKYLGVTFHKASNKWRARISIKKKEIYLGLYFTEEEAARAYDKYCWEKFKRLDILNFPEEYGDYYE